MFSRFSLVLLFLMCGCVGALAQRPGGVPSAPGDVSKRIQITVRVSYDNDRGEPANLQVALATQYGSTVDLMNTDGSGTAIFRGLQPGKYRIIVTGPTIDKADSGEIDLSEAGPNYTESVVVHKTDGPRTSLPGGATSVTDLNVPEAARKEFDKGLSRMDRKDWNGAKGYFEQALAIYPKYAVAKNGLAMSYAGLGQGAKAVETFRDALTLDEHLQSANMYLGQFYYDNKEYKEAEPFLMRAATADPQNAQILTALANSELRVGKMDEALSTARKVHTLKDHGKFAVAHLIAAEVLMNQAQNAEAAKEYELFLKEDPKSPLAGPVRQALAKLNGNTK